MHLDAQQPSILQDYLRRRGWLDNKEIISSIEKPGEGNMNYTLRVTTPFRSLIVKQSRAYVEKYPTIPAPANRTAIEGSFYQEIQPIPMLARAMPQCMGVDRENNVLVLEDLGNARDYTFLYQPGQTLSESDAQALVEYLSELHYHFATQPPGPNFANKAMRVLNHEHIFNYPFVENADFDLDTVQPGLAELARPFRQDMPLKRVIRQTGQLYLADSFRSQPGSSFQTGASKTLLHGDYYPGSWLQTENGVKVIDPEFCFYGPAEFDLGVMLAHLIMARQPVNILNTVLSSYQKPAGFDETLRQRFTGIEIMRRLMGLAQLPLRLSLDQKRTLLDESRQMLL